MFWRALTIGLLLCAAYAVLPASWSVLRYLVIYPAAGLLAAVSVLVGVRRFRPVAPQAWLLIGAGLCSNLIADVITGVYLVLDRDPFPSAAVPFYVAVYPLLAAGLVVAIVQRGRFGADVRAVIDAGIITVVGGLLAWVYVIEPVLHDDDTLDRTSPSSPILYPMGDLLLLAVAVRFLMGSNSRGRALRMVVTGLGLILVGDILFALNTAKNPAMDRVSDVALLGGVVFIGVAALDPTMRALTEDDRGAAVQSNRFRSVVASRHGGSRARARHSGDSRRTAGCLGQCGGEPVADGTRRVAVPRHGEPGATGGGPGDGTQPLRRGASGRAGRRRDRRHRRTSARLGRR